MNENSHRLRRSRERQGGALNRRQGRLGHSGRIGRMRLHRLEGLARQTPIMIIRFPAIMMMLNLLMQKLPHSGRPIPKGREEQKIEQAEVHAGTISARRRFSAEYPPQRLNATQLHMERRKKK